jgi:serine/threonine protein kinase
MYPDRSTGDAICCIWRSPPTICEDWSQSLPENQTAEWEAPRQLRELRGNDLETGGIVFRCGHYLYRTTGREMGHGGMGTVFLLARRQGTDGQVQAVIGKVFHSDYLLQLRTDEASRREHDLVMRNIDTIAEIDHPHLLPTYVSTQIADNFLIVSPLRAGTLRESVLQGTLSPRRKVELLMQAMSGLSAVHRHGYLHRDFTLRNILVDEKQQTASLFDFDLALSMAEVEGFDYKTRFQGRIFGSPGYSLAPEVLDTALMASPIEESLDIYALGTSIFALFTEELPYGEADDMWSLLLRVSEGVVRGGKSYIPYPSSVPEVLRPIIEACMQRTPSLRPKSADEVIGALREALPKMQEDRRRTSSFQVTMRYGDKTSRLQSVEDSRKDPSVSVELIGTIDQILQKQGYQLQGSLGLVKGNAIFLAAPDPELLALGRFPDANTYAKIVTVLDLSERSDREEIAEKWMSRYLPALRLARQGLLTPLHRVVWDEEHGFLLLLSEHVEDARFGQDLDKHVLELPEALGLGYLVARQVDRLHQNGLAHNNVCAEALLLKGNATSRRVYPAMVGIVAPSEDQLDMREDAQGLAALLLSWISDAAVQSAEPGVCARIEVIQSDLQMIVDDQEATHTVTRVIELCEDGLSALDFNFGVLRENGGDLQAYALLLVSHSIYGRLWS